MPSGGQNKLARDTLMRDINGLARSLGDAPTQSQYRERGRHSVKAVQNEFGTWNGGLEACGLPVNHRNNTRIPIECKYCGTVKEKRPSRVESSKYNYCSTECVSEHKKVRYSGDGNPRSTLKPVECENCGDTKQRPRWHREQVDKHFCGFGCWGEYFSEAISGEANPRYSPLPNIPRYGDGWDEARLEAIIRNQARCQYEGCDNTIKDHIEKSGREFDIHHIVPLAEFYEDGEIDHDKANAPSNLIPVCRSCHRKVEDTNQI